MKYIFLVGLFILVGCLNTPAKKQNKQITHKVNEDTEDEIEVKNLSYYIIDGHHRWCASFILNPKCKISKVL